MSDTYLDSNFLLKLYLNEPDSPLVDSALKAIEGSTLVTKLTDVEVVSCLYRRLPLPDGQPAAEAYLTNRTAGTFEELAMDGRVFEEAVTIAERYAKLYKLKSLDILHLATAKRHSIPSIATFDKRLREAAHALGLRVLPA